ncbi:unnamed protein product [Protopolystoma xenopodis]|uniref:Uncharacterized protein n=1 Tax=Protopolystoma xenopodis TaxID=117903 RepID=A0A448WH78_9PLAT|nr:unnamed protein product [Protopolystoma xenopodis]
MRFCEILLSHFDNVCPGATDLIQKRLMRSRNPILVANAVPFTGKFVQDIFFGGALQKPTLLYRTTATTTRLGHSHCWIVASASATGSDSVSCMSRLLDQVPDGSRSSQDDCQSGICLLHQSCSLSFDQPFSDRVDRAEGTSRQPTRIHVSMVVGGAEACRQMTRVVKSILLQRSRMKWPIYADDKLLPSEMVTVATRHGCNKSRPEAVTASSSSGSNKRTTVKSGAESDYDDEAMVECRGAKEDRSKQTTMKSRRAESVEMGIFRWTLCLHLLVDLQAGLSLQTLFSTWRLPDTQVYFYPIQEAVVSDIISYMPISTNALNSYFLF